MPDDDAVPKPTSVRDSRSSTPLTSTVARAFPRMSSARPPVCVDSSRCTGSMPRPWIFSLSSLGSAANRQYDIRARGAATSPPNSM